MTSDLTDWKASCRERTHRKKDRREIALPLRQVVLDLLLFQK